MMQRKKLRFLFIQPEFHRHYVKFFPVYEPLHGLLMGALIDDIADTVLFDRRFDTDANLEKIAREFSPDLVGATTHTAGELLNVHRLLSIVKREAPNAVTIVGGQHATLLPEDLFHPAVDLVCIGPGEETFREVAETVAAKGDLSAVDGLAVRSGDHYLFTPPRALCSGTFSWPRFNRSLLLKKYRKHYWMTFERRRTVYTITTSGCPHRCSFCSLWAAARGTYRKRAPEEIADDIASQPQPYVHLTDDNTFANESHAMAIYQALKRRHVKKKILAYARCDTILSKVHVFEKWKEIGLGALVVGMEAVNNRHLTAVNKKCDIDINIQAQKVLDNLDIENWAHFVCLPEFEKADFDEMWEFVDRLNITYPVFVPMTPVPGTPLFFEAKKAGQLSVFDYGFYNLQYMVMKTKIPKEQWYDHLLDLYAKSCSYRTLLKRRQSPSFHYRPGIGRALAMGPIVNRLRSHIDEQVRLERTQRYLDLEPYLPPSLRRDYRADRYYNAPSFKSLHPERPVAAAETGNAPAGNIEVVS